MQQNALGQLAGQVETKKWSHQMVAWPRWQQCLSFKQQDAATVKCNKFWSEIPGKFWALMNSWHPHRRPLKKPQLIVTTMAAFNNEDKIFSILTFMNVDYHETSACNEQMKVCWGKSIYKVNLDAVARKRRGHEDTWNVHNKHHFMCPCVHPSRAIASRLTTTPTSPSISTNLQGVYDLM